MTADLNTVFCTAQTVGDGVANSLVGSTDWIDFKVAQDNAGGTGPVVEILVTTNFAGGTGAKFRLAAVDSAGSNAVIIDQTADIALASLVVGSVFHLRMSPRASLPSALLTHLRLYASNTGTNTTGAITAHLQPEVGSDLRTKAYASGW